MGQKLSQRQRETLLKHPHVARVTAEHLILHDGTVLDPSEFVVTKKPMFLIRKLAQCRCEGRPHLAGKHEMVLGTVGETVLGNQIEECSMRYCPTGTWTTEERVTNPWTLPTT